MTLYSSSSSSSSLYPSSSIINPSTPSSSSSSSSSSSLSVFQTHFFSGAGIVSVNSRTTGSNRFMVLFSTHSNPKILKSNRRSRYGQALSPYDTDEDEEEEEDGFGDLSEDDCLTEDEFAEISYFDAKRNRPKLKRGFVGSSQKKPEKGHSRASSSFAVDKGFGSRNGKLTLEKSYARSHYHSRKEVLDIRKEKLNARKIIENKYPRLAEEIDKDEKWLPLID